MPDKLGEIRRDVFSGHVWREEGTLIRMIQNSVSKGKSPLGYLRRRWEDQVTNDVENVRLEENV